MGAGGDINGIFGITSVIIAVPTGVKVFDWLATMYGGRIRITTAMLWSLGFMVTFVVGGATGVPLSDIVMFAAFFAGYAVLRDGTADGPAGRDLPDLGNTATETVLLLLSSFACGLASLALGARKHLVFQAAMAVTFLLGAAFLVLEGLEFADLVGRGAGPSRSAFLSAFFTLVGCHGLHVTSGLL